VSELTVAGTPLYRRDFANGIVVVNPGASATTLTLPRTYYNAASLDALGNPRPVTSIRIGARDAAFLLSSSATASR
jgi:hypothetical protein